MCSASVPSRPQRGQRLAHWALKRGQELEGWGDGICLLDEWYPFRCPGPRMGRAR